MTTTAKIHLLAHELKGRLFCFRGGRPEVTGAIGTVRRDAQIDWRVAVAHVNVPCNFENCGSLLLGFAQSTRNAL
jgi:hypothetical protein